MNFNTYQIGRDCLGKIFFGKRQKRSIDGEREITIMNHVRRMNHERTKGETTMSKSYAIRNRSKAQRANEIRLVAGAALVAMVAGVVVGMVVGVWFPLVLAGTVYGTARYGSWANG